MVDERAKISAFIVCMNEEKHIRRCLTSLTWCDEVILVDSGSSDSTLSIAREFHPRIIERPWPGFVAQKQFGLSECSSDWVINLDADEEVSSELREDILKMLARDARGEVVEKGFFLPRVVFYLGKWWRKGGWHPEFRLRVCKRSHTTWGGDDPHDKACVDGQTGRFNGELHHFTYDDITHHMRSLNSHSAVAAQTMFRKGRKSSLVKMFIHPPLRFLKFYFLKKGFREGFPGLLVACFEGWYVFLKYAKLWELNRSQKAPE